MPGWVNAKSDYISDDERAYVSDIRVMGAYVSDIWGPGELTEAEARGEGS